ncbi:MAG: hypothetical protein KatS3mg112_0191 [Thermogutta sp.]|nr:MAG: hypothetical protein KatS3mg112_0191 [Thermogutta sp.]
MNGSYHVTTQEIAQPGRACFGGTRSSGPPFDVGLSIPLYRGLKSRVESEAKAPHSMECGDSSPLFGEGFSRHNLAVEQDGIG